MKNIKKINKIEIETYKIYKTTRFSQNQTKNMLYFKDVLWLVSFEELFRFFIEKILEPRYHIYVVSSPLCVIL